MEPPAELLQFKLLPEEASGERRTAANERDEQAVGGAACAAGQVNTGFQLRQIYVKVVTHHLYAIWGIFLNLVES